MMPMRFRIKSNSKQNLLIYSFAYLSTQISTKRLTPSRIPLFFMKSGLFAVLLSDVVIMPLVVTFCLHTPLALII